MKDSVGQPLSNPIGRGDYHSNYLGTGKEKRAHEAIHGSGMHKKVSGGERLDKNALI